MKLSGGGVVPWATMYMDARSGLAISLPVVALVFAGGGCGKTPPAPEETPAVTSAAVSATAVSPPPSKDMPTMTAKSVKATFLIDAPREKIKGVSNEGEGNVSLLPNDLAKTTGTLKVKLSTLAMTCMAQMLTAAGPDPM